MSWIQTYSGVKFDLLNPTSAMVNISDIAHALSNICRFTGHCSQFYSVAQHSTLVASKVPTLQALLHDAAEAYIQDISTPLKPLLTNYREIEARIWAAVCDRFNLPVILDDKVKLHDGIALVTERRDLLLNSKHLTWDAKYEKLVSHAYKEQIVPLSPREAEYQFLQMYYTIRNTHENAA